MTLTVYTVPENVELLTDHTPPHVRNEGRSVAVWWEGKPDYQAAVRRRMPDRGNMSGTPPQDTPCPAQQP